MEIGIRTEAKDLRSGEVRHVVSCYFTMVAVDDDAKPVAIKKFRPETELELRHWRDGERRREMRNWLNIAPLMWV